MQPFPDRTVSFVPRSGSPYGPVYERALKALRANPQPCTLRLVCDGAPATSLDHDPPLASHTHIEGSGCCTLRPACLRCQQVQGGQTHNPHKGRSLRYTEMERLEVFALLEQGYAPAEVSRRTGVTRSQISSWVQTARRRRERAELGSEEELQDLGIPGPTPTSQLTRDAKRALRDFAFFRRRYFGRATVPWQLQAVDVIATALVSPEETYIDLNVFPGAGKTTLLHDAICWLIVRDRTIRIMVFSASLPLATQMTDRVRMSLMRPEILHAKPAEVDSGLAFDADANLIADFGRFQPLQRGFWQRQAFTVDQAGGVFVGDKEPTVTAYGMESQYIGHRANIVIADDVCNTDNVREGPGRDRLLERWDDVVEPRLEPGGVLFHIGQRLGVTDLHRYCLDKLANPDEDPEARKYAHLAFAAYDQDRDQPELRGKPWPDGPMLDPLRLSWRKSRTLMAKRKHWETVYQQRDVEADTALIEDIWVRGGEGYMGERYPGCLDHERQLGVLPFVDAQLLSIATVDPSPSEWWAVQWWVMDPRTETRWLVDAVNQRMAAEEFLGWEIQGGYHTGLAEVWQTRSERMLGGRHRITHWIVEANAAQRFLLQHDFVRRFEAKHRCEIKAHNTGYNKLDEDLGVQGLLPNLWRTGMIRLPFAAALSSDPVNVLIREMLTWYPAKKQATDQVMAHWFAELHWPKVAPPRLPPLLKVPAWLERPWGAPLAGIR